MWVRFETGCGKFALRALSQCLARELQPLGIHVAHIIIDGVIGPPRFNFFISFFFSHPESDTPFFPSIFSASKHAQIRNEFEEIDFRTSPTCHRGGASSSSSSSTSSVGSHLQSGIIGDGSMDPDALAHTYWHLHLQDRTAWTQEIDLRPSNPRLF